MAWRGSLSRSLMSTARASSFRSSPAAPRVRPPPLAAPRLQTRRLSFTNPRSPARIFNIHYVLRKWRKINYNEILELVFWWLREIVVFSSDEFWVFLSSPVRDNEKVGDFRFLLFSVVFSATLKGSIEWRILSSWVENNENIISWIKFLSIYLQL